MTIIDYENFHKHLYFKLGTDSGVKERTKRCNKSHWMIFVQIVLGVFRK